MTPPSDLPLIFEIYGWNAAALRPFRKACTVNFIIVVSSIVILRIISSFCEKCKYFIIPFSYVTAFSIGLLTFIIIQHRSVTFLKFFSTRKKPRLPRRTRLTFPFMRLMFLACLIVLAPENLLAALLPLSQTTSPLLFARS